jgi:hypothetical protein
MQISETTFGNPFKSKLNRTKSIRAEIKAGRSFKSRVFASGLCPTPGHFARHSADFTGSAVAGFDAAVAGSLGNTKQTVKAIAREKPGDPGWIC